MARSPRNTKGSTTKTPERGTIGRFVRLRRTANGMTLRDLAELAGIGMRALWELENDKPTIRLDTVNAVLQVFGKRVGVVDAQREVE